MNTKTALSLLFDRPKEPIFMEKGREGVIFEVPANYCAERFEGVAKHVMTRFGNETSPRVTIEQCSSVPEMAQFTKDLARDDSFSLLNLRHSKLAGNLISFFMSRPTIEDLLSSAAYVRDRINPQLFNYALSVVLLHRKDTQGVKVPSLAETFPEKFICSRVIRQAREDLSIIPNGSRAPIAMQMQMTASDRDPEQKLWYFREDIGANLHHWHWHLVYPFDSAYEIVNKHRRGELFYYMHKQLGSRYACERICLGMADVKRLSDFRAPIEQGYFPKLSTLIANRTWPSRPDGITPTSVLRDDEDVRFDLDEMEKTRDLFIKSIEEGFVTNADGARLPLDEFLGIDILGNMMESSLLSPNREVFGNLHNSMHNIVAYAHDPNHRHLEDFGVTADNTTAMRDPVFYQIHSYVDDLFQLHKAKLEPYTDQQLQFEGVAVKSLQVREAQGAENVLNTFWQQSDINLVRGLDFSLRGDVFARITHLQNTPFTTTITVENNGSAMRAGTCRLFMAPKLGFTKLPMTFDEQRHLMIEIDKFIVQLSPGLNTINRRSIESSVTIPYEQTFRSESRNRPETGTDEEQELNLCGCGWPNHLLIPKGSPGGIPFELFCMISDYEDDEVPQELVGQCNKASSYCGVRDGFYPDHRAMGFPFDRLPRANAPDLKSFLKPNMKVQGISIVFNDRVVQRNHKMP